MPSVQSMTAFARREASFAWGTLSWEIRSVNHRYLEAQLRLPETLRQVEMPARELLRERLARGKVDCILRLQAEQSATGPIAINEDLVRSLHEACTRVESLAGGLGRPGVLDLLRWPGVIAESHPDEDEIARSALAVFRQALDELVAMRSREGASLAASIEQRLAGIESIVASVRAVLPDILAAQKQKLVDRLAEAARRGRTRPSGAGDRAAGRALRRRRGARPAAIPCRRGTAQPGSGRRVRTTAGFPDAGVQPRGQHAVLQIRRPRRRRARPWS